VGKTRKKIGREKGVSPEGGKKGAQDVDAALKREKRRGGKSGKGAEGSYPPRHSVKERKRGEGD